MFSVNSTLDTTLTLQHTALQVRCYALAAAAAAGAAPL
jgi:hypothetical protein